MAKEDKKLNEILSMDFKNSNGDWKPFIAADIEKKHDIKEVAKKDAQRGLPTSEGLSNCENEIIQEGHNYIVNVTKIASRSFDKLEKSVSVLLSPICQLNSESSFFF